MKAIKIIQFVFIGLLIINCSSIKQKKYPTTEISNISQSNWIETFGIITESTQMVDGTYAYTTEYIVIGGNAKNIDRDLIQSSLPQRIFSLEKANYKRVKN